MNRRRFFSMLPLAPIAATSVVVNGTEGERRPIGDKRFIFVFPSVHKGETLQEIKQYLTKQGYKDALVIGGRATEDFRMYEVDKS
jgi:hypothetical protein